MSRRGQSFLIRLISVLGILTAALLAACGTAPNDNGAMRGERTLTPFSTLSADTLAVTGTSASGERLRVIIPAITLAEPPPATVAVQVFIALVDPQGTYSYLLYPAPRHSDEVSPISLVEHPLEIGINETTPYVALWALAYYATGDTAARALGWDALATSLVLSFRTWLHTGDSSDDPLAGAIRASDGALYAWFAEVNVVGQALTQLDATDGWETELGTLSAPGGTLSVVFDVDHLPAGDTTTVPNDLPATTTPAGIGRADYALVFVETFDERASAGRWYQGRSRPFVNEVVGSGYQIRLLDPSRQGIAKSRGALGGVRLEIALMEAEAWITEGDPATPASACGCATKTTTISSRWGCQSEVNTGCASFNTTECSA